MVFSELVLFQPILELDMIFSSCQNYWGGGQNDMFAPPPQYFHGGGGATAPLPPRIDASGTDKIPKKHDWGITPLLRYIVNVSIITNVRCGAREIGTNERLRNRKNTEYVF